MYEVEPQGACPLDAALLQEEDQAVCRGGLSLDHGEDVLWGAVGLPVLGLWGRWKGRESLGKTGPREIVEHNYKDLM